MRPSAKRPAALGTIGFMIAAVIFAAIAGVLFSQVLASRYSREPVKPVVVAARHLPSGEPIKADDLALANWPASAVPEGAFAIVEKVVKAKGVPLRPLVRGEPVLKSHLSERRAGIGIASLLEPGRRAVSIKVEEPVALARLAYPGALVDVINTVHLRSTLGMPRPRTQIVLQNVTVLAVGEDIDPMTSSRRGRLQSSDRERPFDEGDPEARQRRSVVTLAVTPQEAEKLFLAANEGKLDIALRNPEDQSIVETEGAMMDPLEAEPADSETSVSLDARLRVQRRTRRKPAPARRQARAAKPVEDPPGPPIRISR